MIATNDYNNWGNINVKETLRELHRKFPNLTLDELFNILDCIRYNYSSLDQIKYNTKTVSNLRDIDC